MAVDSPRFAIPDCASFWRGRFDASGSYMVPECPGPAWLLESFHAENQWVGMAGTASASEDGGFRIRGDTAFRASSPDPHNGRKRVGERESNSPSVPSR